MAEEWRPVVGYEGLYEVSNQGVVRRCDRCIQSHGKARIALHKKPNGYYSVTLCRNWSCTYPTIQGVVAAAFLGPRPHGYQVDHKDGNPANNCIENLEYVTPKENRRRGIERILALRGVAKIDGKLTREDVITIRRLAKEGVRPTVIARQFGVAQPHISQIVRYVKWGSTE